ncbi:E3 ubiquitin-protein ligase At3g02290 [Linum grandiflorum]
MGGFLCCFQANRSDNENDDRSSESFCLLPAVFKKFGKKATNSTKANRGSSSSSPTSNASYHSVRLVSDPLSLGSASNLVAPTVDVVSKTGVEEECAICLEVYDYENPKIYMQCMHYYHLSCAYEWMQRSATCPVCSKELLFQELN